MKEFVCICRAEIRKHHKNYYNSFYSIISLFVWPILTYFTTYYTYYSFPIDALQKYGIDDKDDLLIFLVIGSLVTSCFWGMVQGALQMKNERENGVMEIVFLSPANRLALTYGRALGGLLQSSWMFAIFSVVIILIKTQISPKTIISIAFGYVIIMFVSTIWGGFINTLFVLTRDADILFTLCDEPMNLFCGMKIPIGAFPFWAKIVSLVYPATYCLAIIRGVFMEELIYISPLMFMLFVICIVFMFLFTVVILNIAEQINRETGNLQLY